MDVMNEIISIAVKTKSIIIAINCGKYVLNIKITLNVHVKILIKVVGK